MIKDLKHLVLAFAPTRRSLLCGCVDELMQTLDNLEDGETFVKHFQVCDSYKIRFELNCAMLYPRYIVHCTAYCTRTFSFGTGHYSYNFKWDGEDFERLCQLIEQYEFRTPSIDLDVRE